MTAGRVDRARPQLPRVARSGIWLFATSISRNVLLTFLTRPMVPRYLQLWHGERDGCAGIYRSVRGD